MLINKKMLSSIKKHSKKLKENNKRDFNDNRCSSNKNNNKT